MSLRVRFLLSLLAVLAIMAVLAAVLVPTITNQIRKGDVNAISGDLTRALDWPYRTL